MPETMDELVRKTLNDILNLIDKKARKIANEDETKFKMLVALNVAGNIGLHCHLDDKIQPENLNKIEQVASLVLFEMERWFSAVYDFNKKKGMN